MSIPFGCLFFRHRTRTEAPSLHRHYPASAVLRTSPTPCLDRPVPRGRPVDRHTRSPSRLPVLHGLPLKACCRPYSGRRSNPFVFGAFDLRTWRMWLLPAAFPFAAHGRLLHHSFSELARRSLTLRPTFSRSHFMTLSTQGSDGFVASTAAWIATGRKTTKLAGWDLHPLKNHTFSRRTPRRGGFAQRSAGPAAGCGLRFAQFL